MAANETIASWGPGNSQTTGSVGYDRIATSAPIPGTNFRGVGFAKRDDLYITEVLKIPANATLTTGVTVDVAIVDDGADPADLGKAVVFEVLVKAIASGTDTLDMTTGAGTAVQATATLAATKGVVTVLSIAVVSASLDGAAAGGHVAIQIRRVGSATADTCNGRVIVPKATAYAY